MSAEFGLALAFITLGSCWASYHIGVLEERTRWEKRQSRERERQARWEEFDDQD
jgi:hypothetical protein